MNGFCDITPSSRLVSLLMKLSEFAVLLGCRDFWEVACASCDLLSPTLSEGEGGFHVGQILRVTVKKAKFLIGS